MSFSKASLCSGSTWCPCFCAAAREGHGLSWCSHLAKAEVPSPGSPVVDRAYLAPPLLLPAPPGALLPRRPLVAPEALQALQHSLSLRHKQRAERRAGSHSRCAARDDAGGNARARRGGWGRHRLEERRDIPLDLSLLLVREGLRGTDSVADRFVARLTAAAASRKNRRRAAPPFPAIADAP